ncbi:glutathione S-transferase [Vineibacter terrae]|uniref:Glutathione S-transferase n=1 Tax=Vineibacter terrae TaxID=2586908 RepID=A0A5C8PK65_9HYPH|nr:glutathione S-transferase [Vineibacter terrae]TXL74266.1 glutathione S-transferase [Vineibacter terrae]
MKLLYQTHSPYARKVLVLAHEAGIADRLQVVHHETSPTRRNETVHAANPLGKVPVLICDDGLALFDSTVICEYLDSLHDGPRLIPAEGRARFLALRLQAIAHGILDAGIAVRWDAERRPVALRWQSMAQAQTGKLLAAYAFLEREVDLGGPVDLGQIALATALTWIDFRDLPAPDQEHPRLRAWCDGFARRPSMTATAYAGATQD